AEVASCSTFALGQASSSSSSSSFRRLAATAARGMPLGRPFLCTSATTRKSLSRLPANWPNECRGLSSGSVGAEMTTDATYRYRSFTWRTSSGARHDYEYVLAQQSAGGANARDALSALEETLPRPPSGCS
ncbi:unnamed protein product, partial [Polarella glacialis]